MRLLPAASGPPPRSGSEGPDPDRWGWALVAATGVLLAAGLAGLALDLDGDGLSTVAELGEGTSPWNGDTEGDGLADGFEVDRGIDPLRADTDGDEVRDRAELERETDPRSPDSDRDGLEDGTERELGTDPRTSDTDNDGVADARERDVGTDPKRSDTDGDRLDDGAELLRGADPWVADTDGDGWDDALEAERGPEDCDGDGIDRIAEADDDNDTLADIAEDEAWACQRDTDGDGLADGRERARACVSLVDCDVDGLEDGTEAGSEFDRLDPDTFAVGLLDGVTRTFQQAGQPPSGDEDADGIPDAWENAEGLIGWGSFDPEPERRDLLVEFVRVEGPDSARHGPGSMQPAYERVERFFEADGDVEMSWIETTVELEEERRPPLIPSSLDGYYGEVLRRAETSANPYVTTVVMNPQHDQREIQHQGVAPIRGMLAAVDYGAHTQIRFESEQGALHISPFVESLVAAGRLDLLERSGITGGGTTAEGEMVLEHEDWELRWGPFWFAQPPVQRFDDGTERRYERAETTLDQAELADTIAHELGHTLGLCHTNLADCRANLSAADREEIGVSTMDERRSSPELAFLDSEWERLRGYLTCPPQRSITLVGEGAGREAVIDAKYEVTLENVLDVGARECTEMAPLPEDLAPTPDPGTYEPVYSFGPADVDDPPTAYEAQAGDRVPTQAPGGAGPTVGYLAVSLALAAAAGAGVVRWRG